MPLFLRLPVTSTEICPPCLRRQFSVDSNLYVATFLNRCSERVVFLYRKEKLSVCSKVKIIDAESHHA